MQEMQRSGIACLSFRCQRHPHGHFYHPTPVPELTVALAHSTGIAQAYTVILMSRQGVCCPVLSQISFYLVLFGTGGAGGSSTGKNAAQFLCSLFRPQFPCMDLGSRD